ncbi:hypothetical protein CI109_100683 [Kwoniella shandongensis]|uniref:Uncharacterized protein n=1 Tax=Kwoniella shandongensis TaxID=1734106 RepID=A0A5M6BZ18_9TREE|nr:uncharacterized protein CI109_003396 [Kwoniella shandongensis]KAA5528108.1 hypothetical protein CI109_003396 [Kwoniella shandongensis]
MGKAFAGEPSSWKHGKAEVADGVSLHYVDVPPSSSPSSTSSNGGKTIILIHGFPQTWYCYRHVIEPLSKLGLRVIAVDYRGAGDSDRPRGGYDKMTMGKDVHTLYKEKLGIGKAIICGSDIGSMVAVSLATQFREDVEALITFEAPIPGTKAYDKATTDPSLTWPLFWHFFFHNIPDLPELLTQGKEKEYISHFYQRLCYDPSFLTETDLDIYTKSFAAAGGIRCGLDTYRAFQQDVKDLSVHIEKHGKMEFPTLTMSGEASKFSLFIEDQTRELASDVEYTEVPGSMHWIMEENPDGWVEVVMGFLSKRKLL